MPLSFGLFGEWGSGKSYFMGLLREQVKTLARSEDNRYCSEIVQIGFNAWHYSDSNLWASLGDEIFERLAGSGETDATRRSACARSSARSFSDVRSWRTSCDGKRRGHAPDSCAR